jgi:hypothetical protein
MEKRSLKLSTSLATDVMGGLEFSNTSSSGRDTQRATTLGSQLHRSTLRTSSKLTIASAHWNL